MIVVHAISSLRPAPRLLEGTRCPYTRCFPECTRSKLSRDAGPMVESVLAKLEFNIPESEVRLELLLSSQTGGLKPRALSLLGVTRTYAPRPVPTSATALAAPAVALASSHTDDPERSSTTSTTPSEDREDASGSGSGEDLTGSEEDASGITK